MTDKIIRENQFDLDGCYLTKSPCRECPRQTTLPECSENCRTLTQLQKLLAGVISCSNTLSEFDEYTLSMQDT